MLPFFLFSDLHAHVWQYGGYISDAGYNVRLEDAIKVIQYVGALGENKQISAAIFTGDLFELRGMLPTSAVNLVTDAIAEVTKHIPLFMLPGNHDQAIKSGRIHALHFLRHAGAKVIDSPQWHFCGDVALFGIPYTDDDDFIKQSLAQAYASWPQATRHVLLMHHGISGALLGSSEIPVRNPVAATDVAQFDQVFCGHYHMPQDLAHNIHYVGAPMQHRWDDRSQQRGYILYQPADNSYIRYYLNFLPEFIVTDIEKLPQIALPPESYVQVKVPFGTDETVKQQLKAQYGINIRSFDVVEDDPPQVQTGGSLDLSKSISPMEVFLEYLECGKQPINEPLDRDRLLELARECVRGENGD